MAMDEDDGLTRARIASLEDARMDAAHRDRLLGHARRKALARPVDRSDIRVCGGDGGKGQDGCDPRNRLHTVSTSAPRARFRGSSADLAVCPQLSEPARAATAPPATAAPTTPAAASLVRFCLTSFFATRRPICQTIQPRSVCPRVVFMAGWFPERRPISAARL